MKSAPVIIILIVAIVAATVLHARKNSRDTDDIDKVTTGLTGIERVLSPDVHIFIKQYNVPNEQWLYCRYALMPRYSVLWRKDLNANDPIDTVVSITQLHPADSITHLITDNRKLLWQHSNDQYTYYLTCNNR